MTRTERLLALIQLLRRHRRPASGRVLADAMGVSLRTVYRDIATLVGQGAPIEGEAGVGFILRPGFLLPPLMFRDEEIEALVLGSRGVAQLPDQTLSQAAADALAKINSVLPALVFASVESGPVEVMYQTRASVEADLTEAVPPPGNGVALFIHVDDLDAVEAAVAGAPIVKPRHTTFYGSTEIYVREPGGFMVGFAEFRH
jgi:biotin operon repressor/uncharacterized glyoxalase superfamily protein PhnB